MVAQRTAQRKALSTPTTKRRRAAAAQPQQFASDGDDPPARELARLQAMRADALAWVAEIERRIAAVEA